MKLDAIKTVVATIGVAEANVGSAIPSNMRRVIYRWKWINTFVGANVISLKKIENGGASALLDYGSATLVNDQLVDPEELKEDSAPLFIVEGPPDTTDPLYVGTSYIRAVATGASMYLTIWYEDTPAPQ